MKIYDKEIYKREQSIKSIVLVIVVFMLGFFTGFIANNPTKQKSEGNNIINTVQENQIDSTNN